MSRLSGKTAIVTGAASGIGQATAKELASEGARVVCGDRNSDGLAETISAIEEAGGVAIGVSCDVTSDDEVAAFVARAVEMYGELNVVVNVAGIGGFKHTHETDMIMRLMPPMQRFGRPYEVAKMIAYLASDDANYVTGESFTIDGGSAL